MPSVATPSTYRLVTTCATPAVAAASELIADPPPSHPVERRLRLLAEALGLARSLLSDDVSTRLWLRTAHPLMSGLFPVRFLCVRPDALREMRDKLQVECRMAR